ncbi:polyisoprenoid-binding protein YceI [Oxalobacteraceae bacterium GrIS 2.11]
MQLPQFLLFNFLLSCCALVSVQGSASEHYLIDPQHTLNTFEYKHWGAAAQRGKFAKSSGFIDLDMAGRSGTINIVIDADSIDTGSSLFDKVMRSATFFDTKHFDKIVFSSTRLIFDDERLAQVEGNLTIKDRSRPVVIDITEFSCRFLELYKKKGCNANGYTRILRSDFNVDSYRPFVSDAVTLYFSVEGFQDE